MKKPTMSAVVLAALFWGGVESRSARCDETLSFNHDIRPILSDFCFACHGPDEHSRGADLRLDQSEDAIDYGAIVPGTPDESLLVERILSDDPDMVMPPGESGKKLSKDQKQVLIEWIRQGAAYQKHWSFEPVPDRVEVPTTTTDWPRNAIDHFVARKRTSKHMEPSPEADRATWLRRVTFDLTGLPPTIDELDAFLVDSSPDAYEKVVDRLLASTAYGERMASMWLDVARYADTFGYQNDVPMEVWPWRDWVIDAFNRNLPYDQFLTDQIAGDLIPDATDRQRLATTFNRLHRQTNEGGSIPEEFRLTGVADRTTTAGTAFLGLTLECCRCHDHKFDPIKQKEFYQLSAYFSDIDEFGLYSHFTYAVPSPSMLLYENEERSQHAAIRERLENARRTYDQAYRTARQQLVRQSESLSLALPEPRQPVYTNALEGDVAGVVGNATVCDGDNAINCDDAPEFGRVSPFSYSIWVRPAVSQERMLVFHQSRAAEDSGFRGLQLTINNGHPEFSMIHFWPGNALRVSATDTIPVDAWTHLAVTHDGSGSAAGLRLFVDGRPVETEVIRDKLTRDITHRKEWGDMGVGSIKLALGARFRDIGFRDGRVDELSVYDLQLSAAEVLAVYRSATSSATQADPESGVAPQSVAESKTDRAAELDSPSAAETDSRPTIERAAAIEHALLTSTGPLADARAALQQARVDENEFVTGVRAIMTMRHSGLAPPTHVLNRGEYHNKGDIVTADAPVFGGVSVNGDSRLDLAQWMTDPSHPLTSRVIVNRMWHLFFGQGIAVTLEDFGSQGSPPSHPELLDYLSRELIVNDWDLHWLCKKIVLSATYRQSSEPADPTDFQRDRDNTWLARGPKHRLSAEQLRDAVLAASGLLVRTTGGPSVMPYQPAGLWKEAGTGKQYRQSAGDGLFRRSLYTFWKRTAPPPTMITFDATNRETCTARRELTTTPLQALVFLNDPQYVEASRVLAERLIANHSQDRQGRWTEMFRRLISRPPTEAERQVIDGLYNEQLGYFRDTPKDADAFLQVGTRAVATDVDHADLAATTIVVQSLFAYDETIMLR